MKLGIMLDVLKGPSEVGPGGYGLGGMERHTVALMRAALEEGDEVVLAGLRGKIDRGLLPDGVTCIEIKAPSGRPERDMAFAERAPAALRDAGCHRVLAFRHATDCDVYMPHGGLVDDARNAGDAAVGGPSRWTRIARAFSRKHAFFVEAETKLLAEREGPLVIAVSSTLGARIRQQFPSTTGRVQVVVNGVDTEHFRPAACEAEGRAFRARFVHGDALVGLLVAHRPRLKGAEAAIRALAEGPIDDIDRPVHLLVAGGRLDRGLRRLIRELALGARVHEVGRYADMRPVYAASDVLVHPTYHDPCSLVCLEGLAMGRPVITTPQNGVRDVMGQRGGIVVEEPGNPEAVAMALRVLADPALYDVTADDARYLALRNRESTRLQRVLDWCRGAARWQALA